MAASIHIRERHPPVGVNGRIRGRWFMQGLKEPGQGSRLRSSGREQIGRLSREPRHNRPRMGEVAVWLPEMEGGRRWERELLCQQREPLDFSLGASQRILPARQANGKVLAKPEHGIVPTRFDFLQSQPRILGELRCNKPLHKAGFYGEVCRGLSKLHRVSMAVRAGWHWLGFRSAD